MNVIRTLLVQTLVLLTLQAGVAGQASKGTDPKIDELIAIDNTWGKLFTSCDIDGMSKLVSDDLTLVQLGGNVWNKSQFMDMVKRCSMEKGERLNVTRAQNTR